MARNSNPYGSPTFGPHIRNNAGFKLELLKVDFLKTSVQKFIPYVWTLETAAKYDTTEEVRPVSLTSEG